MKKILFVFLIGIGFFIFNITEASAGCNIVWTGTLSGTLLTQETSRTEQAAQELYNKQVYIGDCYEMGYGEYGYPPASFSNNCYGFDAGGFRSVFHKWVCTDGTWIISCEYACGPDRYCRGHDSGSWDVVCENITTTITPNTTTTTTPSTVIELDSFTANPKAGKVLLQWNTESEIENAGLNLYRSESETGEYIKINSTLIPAKGSSTQGASYEFIDNNVKNRKNYYYKLEDIDFNGQSTMHEPVSAMPRWIFGIFGK